MPSREERDLTPDGYCVLLALAAGSTSIAAIEKQLAWDSIGRIEIPKNTLNNLLGEMIRRNFVEKGKRDEYKITQPGRDYLYLQGAVWERFGELVLKRIR